MKGIYIVIWDFDGTLYKLIPKLKRDLRRSEYRVVADHTGWSKQKVRDEFGALFKKKFHSATQVVAFLTKISVAQAAKEMGKYYDRTKFLKKDARLIAMFTRLSLYTHYFLVNGRRSEIFEAIDRLGLSQNIFKEVVTAEIVGDNKPSLGGFEYILRKTGRKPEEHLMVGDRIDVDLVPAKELGMKTCLVWSADAHPSVDVSVPSIYDVEKLLL